MDGKEYIEYGMGKREVGIGNEYKKVVREVREELKDGWNFKRKSDIEIEWEERFIEMIEGEEMVKLWKEG